MLVLIDLWWLPGAWCGEAFSSYILVIVTRSPVAPDVETREKDLQYAAHMLVIPPRAEGRQYQIWSRKAWADVLGVAESKNLCKF